MLTPTEKALENYPRAHTEKLIRILLSRTRAAREGKKVGKNLFEGAAYGATSEAALLAAFEVSGMKEAAVLEFT